MQLVDSRGEVEVPRTSAKPSGVTWKEMQGQPLPARECAPPPKRLWLVQISCGWDFHKSDWSSAVPGGSRKMRAGDGIFQNATQDVTRIGTHTMIKNHPSLIYLQLPPGFLAFPFRFPLFRSFFKTSPIYIPDRRQHSLSKIIKKPSPIIRRSIYFPWQLQTTALTSQRHTRLSLSHAKMSDSAQTRDSMYCHGCHHQWQRQGEDIECPSCHSASTEIVRESSPLVVDGTSLTAVQITSDDDPRHFHGRQTQQPQPATTSTPVPVYGPERPPSTAPPQSNSRPSSRNGSTQDNDDTQRPAPATHQFIFAPVTFHFTIISDRAPPPQAQPQQASTTQEQQHHAPHTAWTDFAGLPFFMPSFHAPPPPPANTTTNSPPTGSTEGASPSAAQSQPQAQTSTQAETSAQPQPENGQQQSQQTPPQRPAGHRVPGPGGFMTLLLASLFDQSGFMFNPNPDGVYSQEAFDRIITQLREANANSGGAPPASQSALDKLQTKEVDDEMLSSEEKPKCVICVDEMVKGEKATILPCNHLFHGECVTIWLKQHNTCPVCRRSIEEEVKATPAKTVDEFHMHGHQHEHENAANSTTGCM